MFRILPDAGIIKHTPNKNDGSHYDFYKSDDFSLESLENHTIIPLNSFLNNE